MKRVTLVVESIGEEPEHGGDLRVAAQGDFTFIPAGWVESVEDVPDPLPTTPGERFWGRRMNDAPQWWYVTRSERRGCVQYAPTLVDYWCDPIEATEVEALGLVRLPDPDVTP